MTSVFCRLRSAPIYTVAVSKASNLGSTSAGWHRMSPSSRYQKSARPPLSCKARCGSSAPVSLTGPPGWKFWCRSVVL